jgi:Tfp pilus assembly protein PilP
MIAGLLLCFGGFGINIQSAMAQPPAKHAGSTKFFAKRTTNKRAASTSTTKSMNGPKAPAPQAPVKQSKDATPVPAESDPADDGVAVAKDVSARSRFEEIAEDPADFHYVGSEKSDPFLPPLISTPEGSKVAGTVFKSQPGSIEIPIVSPLQQYDLNQLNVVGVWQLTTGERKAMILAPANGGGAGQGIIVKTGDPVGNRGGKITSIGEEYVNVREFMLAPDGSRRYLDQKMQMGKKNAEELPRKIRFTPGAARTTLVKENDVDFEKIMIDEGKKQNPGAVDPGRDQPLNPPLVAPVGAPVGQPVGGPEAGGAAGGPVAADKEGVLDLVKKMLMGGEGAKGGLGTQEADQQTGQPNADEKAATAFRDLQSEKVPDAGQTINLPEKAPVDAGEAVRKVF